MVEKQQVKEFVENYKDANGDNPIAAAFSLWTIAKAVPFQLIKSVSVALLVFLITLVLGWYMDVPWGYYLLLIIGGTLGFLFLVFFGGVKFLSGIVINSVSEVLVGLISPIDDMYDVYKEYGEENLSRSEFTKRAFQDVVFPRVSGVLEFVPMKKSISKSVGLFTDNLSQEEDEVSYEDIKGSRLKSSIAKINRSAKKTNRIIGKPFRFFLILFIMSWIGVVVGAILGYY